MRRIIIGLAILTLTACGDVVPDTPRSTDAAAAPDSVRATTSPPFAQRDPTATGVRRVLFVGTSLTAGYGVGDDAAYPARIQQKIDSAGLPFEVVNAGISGETSAGGLRRIDWSLQQPADVLVLELGANDGLRGLPVAELRRNLDAILTRARAAWPGIQLVLVGMEAPPNLGSGYAADFRAVYRDLAGEHDAALVPFLLDSVAAEPALNLEDGVHPNAEGHGVLARTVWRTLEPVLRRRLDQPPSSDRS